MLSIRHQYTVGLILFFVPTVAISQPFGISNAKTKMVNDWIRAKDYTLNYLNAMPTDKYEFRPVDSVMSFAEQMIHLSVTSAFFVFIASDKTPPEFTWADINSRPNSHSKDSVLHYVKASYDYCINSIKSLNSNTWGQTKVLSNRSRSRYEILLHAFEHQTHHRGQTTVYLRLQGVIPPEDPF